MKKRIRIKFVLILSSFPFVQIIPASKSSGQDCKPLPSEETSRDCWYTTAGPQILDSPDGAKADCGDSQAVYRGTLDRKRSVCIEGIFKFFEIYGCSPLPDYHHEIDQYQTDDKPVAKIRQDFPTSQGDWVRYYVYSTSYRLKKDSEVFNRLPPLAKDMKEAYGEFGKYVWRHQRDLSALNFSASSNTPIEIKDEYCRKTSRTKEQIPGSSHFIDCPDDKKQGDPAGDCREKLHIDKFKEGIYKLTVHCSGFYEVMFSAWGTDGGNLLRTTLIGKVPENKTQVTYQIVAAPWPGSEITVTREP